MSQQQDDSMAAFLAKTATMAAAWFTSWTLGEVQQVVGIASGLVLLGYTVAQWRALRRREKQGPAAKEREAS